MRRALSVARQRDNDVDSSWLCRATSARPRRDDPPGVRVRTTPRRIPDRNPHAWGFERWHHPDGSDVWVRSGGEIVRVPNRGAVAGAGLVGKGWRVDGLGNIVRPHAYTPERLKNPPTGKDPSW